VLIAAVPIVAVLTGAVDSILDQAHVPIWLAAVVLSLLSVAFAARIYVFGVLPTLAACWLLAHFT
jgi:hypothetical protein